MLDRERMRAYQRDRRARLRGGDVLEDKKVPCLGCARLSAEVLQRGSRIKELEKELEFKCIPEQKDGSFKLVMLQKRYDILEKEVIELRAYKAERQKSSPYRGF